MAAEKTGSRNKLIIRLAIVVVIIAIAVFAYMFFSERARILNGSRYFTYGENKFKEAQGIPIDPTETVSVTQKNQPIDLDLAYEAVDNYRKSVTYDEQRAESWVGMANVFTRIKEFDKAIEVLEEASNVDFEQVSNKVSIFTSLGDRYYATGQYGKAAGAYDEAIAASPQNPIVALGYAKKVLSKLELEDHSEIDQFVEWVRQGQQLDSRAENQHIYHYALGWTYAERGRDDQALAEYNEAMSFKNNYPPLLYKIAKMEQEKGQFLEPYLKYRRATEISTYQGSIYLPAQTAYQLMQEELENKAVEDHAALLIKIADYYAALKETDGAEENVIENLYAKVIDLAPTSAPAAVSYAKLASELLNTRDTETLLVNSEKAIAMAEKGVAVSDSASHKAQNYVVMAKALRARDEYQKAIEASVQAVNADNTDFRVHLELTISYYEAYTDLDDSIEGNAELSEKYLYKALESIKQAKALVAYDRDVESYNSRVTRAVERLEQQKQQ